ncbi:MAG: DUF3604 domain-containing protein [Halieaceae bacterium]|nr:DUF3604 domain-containing protein [Halieaceae bacterium]
MGAVLAGFMLHAAALAAAPGGTDPCPGYNPLNNVYWGDLHVHTRYSLDASTQDTRTTPAEAYAFARGEPLGVQPWRDGKPLRTLKLDRPLDFAAVTDHAELLGEVELCTNPDSEGWGSLWCRGFRAFPRAAFFLFNSTAASGRRLGLCGEEGERCLAAASAPWRDIVTAAENANDDSGACEFTSFIAYEWTGASDTLANIHRNVIFRNSIIPDLPISFVDSSSAPALYQSLEDECLETGSGCDVMVIPHNSNLSDGYMFRLPDTLAGIEQQRRFEPLMELIQHKGSSECFYAPGISEDELCAFEQLPYNTFSGKFMRWNREPPAADDGFARGVLTEGLAAWADGSANPFELGFIGSTDTHLGTPGAVDEKGFAGHGGAGAPAGDEISPGLVDDLEFNPGGLAAVWAPQNRRDDLFDALRRREAYATSGPRISLRMFAGENLDPGLCESPDLVAKGYAQGAPMGSVVSAANGMRIAVMAQRDPASLPLQRVQVIKGWVGADGTAREKVYEVAGDPDNGATVDLASCQPRGAGAGSLCTVWSDPDFAPDTPAFYYTRAVENPSCRWSQHFCAAQGVNCANPDSVQDSLAACCAPEHRPTIQERAVSSPVWYYPDSPAGE